MNNIKETAIRAISKLPDNSGIDDIMYVLYVIYKIEKGKDAVKNNNVISSHDLKKEIAKW